MTTDLTTIERIDHEIRELPLADQVCLMERLARRIREQTVQEDENIEAQLDAMAADPQIQRELRAINKEFAGTESDGLDDM